MGVSTPYLVRTSGPDVISGDTPHADILYSGSGNIVNVVVEVESGTYELPVADGIVYIIVGTWPVQRALLRGLELSYIAQIPPGRRRAERESTEFR